MSTVSLPLSRPYSIGRSSADYWGPRFVLLIVVIWGASLAVGFQASLAVLTGLGFLAAIVGLKRPFLGLLGVGMLCTLDPLTRVYLMTGGLLRWNTFNYWLLIVIVMSAPLLLRRKDPQSRLLQLFALLMAAEIALAPGWIVGTYNVLLVVSQFGLLVYFIRAGWDERAWYWLAIVCGTLGAVGGLLFYMQGGRIPEIDANALCYFPLTALLIIYLGFRFTVKERRGQLLLGSLAAVNFCWVFFTGSRGGTLVSLAAASFLLLEIPNASRRFMLAVAAGVVGLVLITQFSDLHHRSADRVRKLLDSSRSMENRTSGRYQLMVGAWRIFQKHPLGVGSGAFPHHWAEYSHQEHYGGASRRGKQKIAHSAWMKTLAENGLPGFLLLAGYVVSFAVVGWKKKRAHLHTVGLMVTVCLCLAFISQEFVSKGLWFLAAGGTVLLHQEKIYGRFIRKP